MRIYNHKIFSDCCLNLRRAIMLLGVKHELSGDLASLGLCLGL